jgi:hypothetical protein
MIEDQRLQIVDIAALNLHLDTAPRRRAEWAQAVETRRGKFGECNLTSKHK